MRSIRRVARPPLARDRALERVCALALVLSFAMLLPGFARDARAEARQLFWGDTHLHTSNSFDAYLNRNMTAGPDAAYRFAKGLPIIHPYHRARVQLGTPLDFLVVADHAVYMGLMRTIVDEGIPTDDLGLVDTVKAWMAQRWIRGVVADDEGASAFASLLPDESSVEEAAKRIPTTPIPGADAIARTVWQDAVRIADAHNEPGRFTTLIGWEWSSIPAGANLHRVVFTSSNSELASKFQPFSTLDSSYPEDLWAWLARTSDETGADFVAIPHNSNISKGYMFAETTLRGDAYTPEKAALRARWEPVAEITQIKGDSETLAEFSPDDPFADFEIYPHYIQQNPPPYAPKRGDYLRPALLRGLAMEAKLGVNPFQYGLIGSTDSHTSTASAEEPNFLGKLARDSIPENKRGVEPGRQRNGWSMSASGLAAVWARENTRDAIFEAFKRREVYGTTGPRIAVRVYGGWQLGEAALARIDALGPEEGVPMGGTLAEAPPGAAPQLVIQALQDPKSAPLDRVQVVKGWLDGDTLKERVFDVAWSGERKRDAAGRVGPVGNTVDPQTATYTREIGTPELATHWRDPDFDPAQPAFYYVRVLEIPTPRHSVFDALALGLDPTEQEPPWWIQERAYTSPIWFRP